jgi:hypothetical protein
MASAQDRLPAPDTCSAANSTRQVSLGPARASAPEVAAPLAARTQSPLGLTRDGSGRRPSCAISGTSTGLSSTCILMRSAATAAARHGDESSSRPIPYLDVGLASGNAGLGNRSSLGTQAGIGRTGPHRPAEARLERGLAAAHSVYPHRFQWCGMCNLGERKWE